MRYKPLKKTKSDPQIMTPMLQALNTKRSACLIFRAGRAINRLRLVSMLDNLARYPDDRRRRCRQGIHKAPPSIKQS